jgi:hypothetical protein
MTTPIGPYMNESGDWWVPVDAASYREARAEVVSCIQYQIPEDGTLLYRGKETVWLDSEHEGHDGDDGEDCPSNRHVLAWHFEDNER